MAKLLKYGQIRGGDQGFPITVAASQYIPAAGGKFVYRTGGAATATLVNLGETRLLGHLEVEALNSSDGTEVRKCVDDPTAIFRIPVVAGTYATTMRGKKTDLKIVSGVQGACLDSAPAGLITVVDGDEVDNAWVDVRITPTTTRDTVV